MLYLVFQVDADRYALATANMVEVLPPLVLKQIPQAAAGVAGVFSYHGVAVPVVDVCALALGRPASESLSTRLVLVRQPVGTDGKTRVLGLLVEKATEAIARADTDFQDTGVTPPTARYLGPVTHDARGLIQRIEVEKILSDAVREQLFRQAEESL